MYGLRKIKKDGKHYNFQWPLKVGATVVCPDWNPEPECGGGLHLLPEGIGDYYLLDGHYWCVVEFDETKMVMIDNRKAKVPECKIVYLSESPNGLAQYFDFNKFDSKAAYSWARNICKQDIIVDKITVSVYAYLWARDIGNQDIMRDKITDPTWAYYWVMQFGDDDMMIAKFPEIKDWLCTD